MKGMEELYRNIIQVLYKINLSNTTSKHAIYVCTNVLPNMFDENVLYNFIFLQNQKMTYKV